MSSWNQPQQQNNIMGQAQFSPYWGVAQYPQTGNYTATNRLPVYKADPIHGENAAWQFPMGPNSEIYLPDADEDLIWWIRTDVNGNKNVIPFNVTPYEKPKQVDMNEISARLAAVEEWINGKQNKSNAKRSATVSANTATTVPGGIE